MKLRKQAIERIYPVFAGAAAVLVIDKALTSAESAYMAITEALAMVASSQWMTRCWTLAEAALGMKSGLIFCLGNSIIRYRDFKLDGDGNKAYKLLDLPSKSFFRDFLQRAFVLFHVAWLASQPLLSDFESFILVWNSLTARSTSWPDDVWGIMATLLGFSGKEIMRKMAGYFGGDPNMMIFSSPPTFSAPILLAVHFIGGPQFRTRNCCALIDSVR
ncbi:hypothetical protein EPUS_01503 [Endocarpon pusillum Z07020]|uniref:Heterokaryon incompatibility domain-containing protein n=1 Tax=Endocarpon pusillum (strain Z07020 / HMAS-L-300199) TaxID=1263415 RepID=U1I2I8_ENDPU|nr:uncharacterized protein EPUS_01503 [Endocarpon pusillum Z07020]ERF76169.1 hypothetical protein EPUS_01503 [Endocarpon pusillum Z07020]